MVNSNLATISLIAAMDPKGVIGKGNALPWRISEELKLFRRLTLGKIIVMGRSTFLSLGAKPLPGRCNVVVTKNITSSDQALTNQLYFINNLTANTLLELPETTKWYQANVTGDGAGDLAREVVVIGGAEIYRQCLPWVQKLYLSFIKQEYIGDVYFPELKWSEWQETASVDYSDFAAKTYVRS